MTHVNKMTAPTVSTYVLNDKTYLEAVHADGERRAIQMTSAYYSSIFNLGYGWYYSTKYWDETLPYIETPFRMTTEGKKD